MAGSQVSAKVALPRKRGSPPAASDCPGSQNLASPLMASPLRARSASAPPSAATACLTRSPVSFCASAGCAMLAPSDRAATEQTYPYHAYFVRSLFMAVPPVVLCLDLKVF